MNFKIGQKVVCVDAVSPPIRVMERPYKMPTQGAIYTVATVTCLTEVPLIRVEELPHAHPSGVGIWYQARRFRPVIERATDISIFTAMLTDTHEPAAAH